MSKNNNVENISSFEELVNAFAKGLKVTELTEKLNKEADRLDLEQSHIESAFYRYEQETKKIDRKYKNLEKTSAKLEVELQTLFNSEEVSEKEVISLKKRMDRCLKRMEAVTAELKAHHSKFGEIEQLVKQYKDDKNKFYLEFQKLGVAQEKFEEVVPDWVNEFTEKLLENNTKEK